ncbi:CBS domain-containing protein [Kistimonas asteriae]|uniref:CBS domain-containing protein n=1 Tax=Kistimonas asteriae TaxID=517724 RepID=UPI001BA83DE1|nr:CBS domain-containing protein [Kistimonas asteriae]
MKKHESIQKVMTTSPITVQKGQKLSDVNAIFREHNIHHVPVLDHKQPVGIIAETDILRLVYDAGNTDNRTQDTLMDQLHTIAEVMSNNLKTLPITATVKDAVEVLTDNRYHSVMVVDNDQLAGIVTSTDIIRYFHSQF